MGTLGASTQTSPAPTFKTARFRDAYFADLSQLGVIADYQKHDIFQRYLKQERDWLNSMDYEYNEIMAAQEAMDGHEGH